MPNATSAEGSRGGTSKLVYFFGALGDCSSATIQASFRGQFCSSARSSGLPRSSKDWWLPRSSRDRGRRGQRGSSLRPSGQAQPHPPGRRHFYRRLFDFVFVQALVAETKGCSLEQIEADLREKASFASG